MKNDAPLSELVEAYRMFVADTDGYKSHTTRVLGLVIESSELADIFHKGQRKIESQNLALK